MSNCATYQSLTTVKRGDTLIIGGVYKIGGNPESLAGFTVASQVRDVRRSLVFDFTVDIPDQVTQPGVFSLNAGEIDWQPGNYVCDIEFTDSTGAVRSTETFFIPVVEDITQVPNV